MVRSNATKFLTGVISELTTEEKPVYLCRIIENIDKENLSSNVIDEILIKAAIKRILMQDNIEVDEQTERELNSTIADARNHKGKNQKHREFNQSINDHLSEERMDGGENGTIQHIEADNAGQGHKTLCKGSSTNNTTNPHTEKSTSIQIISAFDSPKYIYNEDRRTFFRSNVNKCLFPTADAKAMLFRDRYQLILQRLKRNPMFNPPAVLTASNNNETYHKLMTTDSLKSIDLEARGSSGYEEGESNMLVLFGMISQIREGVFYLEDTTGNVPLDLNRAQITCGMFVETTMVLAQGIYNGNAFEVKVLGFPPLEGRETSLGLFRSTNFFGGTYNYRQHEELLQLEKSNQDAMMVVMSDVWLDQPKVLRKLREMFEGYSQQGMLPNCFVLIGDFSREPYGSDNGYITLRDHFQELANILIHYPMISKHSQFIFVPGPKDPGPADVIPRPPLSQVLTQPIRDVLKHVTFTSNPCRLRYGTQEIVIFRENLVSKMRRHCIINPDMNVSSSISTHLVRTILDQSHLCPLPHHLRPSYWGYDHSLRLYPLPSSVIIADKYEPFDIDMDGVSCFNPGSFLSTDFSFVVYWLSDRSTEMSKIS